MSVCMTQSERIRYIQEQANRTLSRNKCVDASLMTVIIQSKASATAAPQTVSAVVDRNDCATNAVVTGRGVRGEYLGILQSAQGCAINPNRQTIDTSVPPTITLPVPCINMQAPPFTQQNLSTMYVAPCTNPGQNTYFPRPIYDGPGCTYNRITTPS